MNERTASPEPRRLRRGLGIQGRVLLLVATGLLAAVLVGGLNALIQDALVSAQGKVAELATAKEAMYQARTRMQTARLRELDYNVTRQDDRAVAATEALEAVRADVRRMSDLADGLIGAQSDAVQSLLRNVQLRFEEIRARQAQLGSTREEGLTGEVEKTGASLEAGVRALVLDDPTPDALRASNAVLQLRRNELRFFASLDRSIEGEISADVSRLENILQRTSLQDSRERLSTMLKLHLAAFEGWSAAAMEIAEKRREIENGLTLVEPALTAAEMRIVEEARSVEEALERSKARFGLLTVLGFLGIVGLGVVAALLIGRGITRPLAELREAMHALAEGRTDVVLPDVKAGDEIGVMARAVAVFRGTALERERLAGETAAGTAAKLARGQAVEAAMRAFEADLSDTLSAVKRAVDALNGSSNTLRAASSDVSSRAATAGAAAHATTDKATSVAGAAEQLAASIREIAGQTDRSLNVAAKASDESDRTLAATRELGTAADRIGQVVLLIQTIASQTNLLALNATIEASRAGDAGRGFAVVAQEVKALAAQTAEATADIAAQVAAIQSSSAITAAATRSVHSVVSEMRSIAASVAAAVEQQDAAVREITASAVDLRRNASDGAGAAADAEEAATANDVIATNVDQLARDLSEEAERLEGMVASFARRLAAA